MNSKFFNNCIIDIVDRISEYNDCEEYPCDIGFEITKGENIDCFWDNNGFSVVTENVDLFGNIVKYWKFNFGSDFVAEYNPLIDFNKFYVSAMISLYEIITNYIVWTICDEYGYDYDNEITIDATFIEHFRKIAETVKEDDIF